MIHYDLRCPNDHTFDGWFRDSASFETQAAQGLLECPLCTATQIERALMAPSLGRKSNRRRRAEISAPEPRPAPAPAPAEVAVPDTVPAVAATLPPPARLPDHLRAALQRLRSDIERNCDYVGDTFADEARRIHHGEAEARGIYGEATPDEAEALAEEGVRIASIPWLPRTES